MNKEEMIEAWKQTKTETEAELVSLEADLKAKFNSYVDSLAAYLKRLKTANDYRNILYYSLEEQRDRNTFGCSAEPFIDNKAFNYLLDTNNPVEIKSTTLVNSCDAKTLLERKAN